MGLSHGCLSCKIQLMVTHHSHSRSVPCRRAAGAIEKPWAHLVCEVELSQWTLLARRVLRPGRWRLPVSQVVEHVCPLPICSTMLQSHHRHPERLLRRHVCPAVTGGVCHSPVLALSPTLPLFLAVRQCRSPRGWRCRRSNRSCSSRKGRVAAHARAQVAQPCCAGLCRCLRLLVGAQPCNLHSSI